VVLVSRILTEYIDDLVPLRKAVPNHILHKYSKEMAMKSEVIVLDVMMKNEAKHSDMIDIMSRMQEYLGHDYPSDRRVPSGGDQLTCEQQVGAQRHTMDGDTVEDQLGQLEPVTEDWYCLVCWGLAGGHMPSVAEAIRKHKELADLVLQHFLDKIHSECSTLCQRSSILTLPQDHF